MLSRSLTIPNFLKPEMSSGSRALPAAPTSAVENWRFLRLFPFLSLISRLGAILVPPSKYLSSPPRSWIRLPVSVEFFLLGRDPASRIYIPSRFVWKDTFIIRPMFIKKHRDGNSVFLGAKFSRIKIFPLSSFFISKSKFQTISLLKS